MMPYVKEIFDVSTFEHAKHVVLTSDPNDPKKFEKETKFLVDKIAETITIDDTTTVLDFGCGIGRVSKELINRFGCKIIGQDISPSMLLFARLYTANINKFVGTYDYSIRDSIDVALSIFALQHAEDPKKEIDNIVSVLKQGGILVLLNENKRFVPSAIDGNNYVIWEDDGFDIFSYIETKMTLFSKIKYMSTDTCIMFYKK